VDVLYFFFIINNHISIVQNMNIKIEIINTMYVFNWVLAKCHRYVLESNIRNIKPFRSLSLHLSRSSNIGMSKEIYPRVFWTRVIDFIFIKIKLKHNFIHIFCFKFDSFLLHNCLCNIPTLSRYKERVVI
jgi:hypothetical protein